MTRWYEVLRAEPTQPRPLTTAELRRLHKLGFASLAQALAAGTCLRTDEFGEKCGLNKSTRCHRETCDRANPLPAPTPIAQPWMPRAPRQRRAA
jgi:hypothetical protein